MLTLTRMLIYGRTGCLSSSRILWPSHSLSVLRALRDEGSRNVPVCLVSRLEVSRPFSSQSPGQCCQSFCSSASNPLYFREFRPDYSPSTNWPHCMPCLNPGRLGAAYPTRLSPRHGSVLCPQTALSQSLAHCHLVSSQILSPSQHPRMAINLRLNILNFHFLQINGHFFAIFFINY